MKMTLTSIICVLTIALLSVVVFTSCSPNAEKKNETIQITESANEDVPDAETINEWRQAAEQGDADAQYNLGVFYSQDDSVDKDMTEAVKWFRKAAELGHVEAQFNLALCYAKGEGVDKDTEEALKWHRKAAENGDAISQLNLGI
ncbi:MAG: sel1 repeat family protein, partial [Thermoguttaceae bacterium]|nr:sel1 repeat family protein [Thermoguttaceae bacterium]